MANGSGQDMDMRELKGLEIAARCKIAYKNGAWLVPSQSGNGTYTVVLKADGDSCTCENRPSGAARAGRPAPGARPRPVRRAAAAGAAGRAAGTWPGRGVQAEGRGAA